MALLLILKVWLDSRQTFSTNNGIKDLKSMSKLKSFANRNLDVKFYAIFTYLRLLHS